MRVAVDFRDSIKTRWSESVNIFNYSGGENTELICVTVSVRGSLEMSEKGQREARWPENATADTVALVLYCVPP